MILRLWSWSGRVLVSRTGLPVGLTRDHAKIAGSVRDALSDFVWVRPGRRAAAGLTAPSDRALGLRSW